MQAESGNLAQRVLVVADDFRIRILARAVLMGKGHQVLVATDARELR